MLMHSAWYIFSNNHLVQHPTLVVFVGNVL